MENEFINLPRSIIVPKPHQKSWQQRCCQEDYNVYLNKSKYFLCYKQIHYKQTGF